MEGVDGGQDIHICGVCKTQFTSLAQFVVHKRDGCSPIEHGPGDGGDKSSDTPGVTTSTSNIKVSSKSPPQCPKKVGSTGKGKNFACTYEGCAYVTAYRKDLKRHWRVHTGEKPYQCKFCEKPFRRMDKLNMHEMIHNGIKPYKCKLCQYATCDNSSLKKHERIHTDERPFKCQMCLYSCRNSSQLVVHLRTHTGDAPYQCVECSARFKMSSDLKRHMRMHTGEKPFSCSACEYKCSIKSNLNTHMRRNHSGDSVKKCPQCDFKYNTRNELRDHLKTHKKVNNDGGAGGAPSRRITQPLDLPYKCPECPFTSRLQEKVLEHTNEQHPDKFPKKGNRKGRPGGTWVFQCTSTTTTTTTTATNATTTAPRPVCQKNFKCHLCDCAFVRVDSLRCHLKCHQKQQQQQQTLTTTTSATSQEEVIEQAMRQSGIWGTNMTLCQQQDQQQLFYQIVPTTIVSCEVLDSGVVTTYEPTGGAAGVCEDVGLKGI